LSARIRTAIASTPASTIGTRTRVLAALAAASVWCAAVVVFASRVVYHRYAPGLVVSAAAAPYKVVVVLLLVTLTAVATLVAISRGRRGLGSGAMWLVLTSALVAPIYAALVIAGPAHAHDQASIAVTVYPWAPRCVALSAAAGLLVLGAFTLALRHSVPAGARLRGAAVGAAAGAWAGLGVFVFCPSDDLQHLLVGHVLPIVALTILGMTVVPRALRL
jgi:hypothetical protein